MCELCNFRMHSVNTGILSEYYQPHFWLRLLERFISVLNELVHIETVFVVSARELRNPNPNPGLTCGDYTLADVQNSGQ